MKKGIKKKYSNDEITVVWKPDNCIHSKICFNGLKEVFDPEKRPWVNIEGADSNTIMKQIDKCPSGALSYYQNSDGENVDSKEESILTAEVSPNGPLILKGAVKITHVDGSVKRLDEVSAFCRCGHSKNKPFCDGTHVESGFKD